MKIVKWNRYMVNGSPVDIKIITDIDWEDLVNFRTKAMIDHNITGEDSMPPPTYRSVKDYLIKGK